MKDFKSFVDNSNVGEKGRGVTIEDGEIKLNGKKVELSGAVLEEADEVAKRYSGADEGEIIREIMRQAEESKKAGTLSNAELDSFYTKIAPVLDAAKRKKLKSIIERLKKI